MTESEPAPAPVRGSWPWRGGGVSVERGERARMSVRLAWLVLLCAVCPSGASRVLARPGDHVQVTCELPAAVPADQVRWFRDGGPAGGLRELDGGRGGGGDRGPAGRQLFSLRVRVNASSDAGLYYCAEYSGSYLRFAAPTAVIVTAAGAPAEGAQVSVLAKGGARGQGVALRCAAAGLRQSWVQLSWRESGLPREPAVPRRVLGESGRGPAGNRVVGTLKLSWEEWSQGALWSCQVQTAPDTVHHSRNISALALLREESCSLLLALPPSACLLFLAAILCASAVAIRRCPPPCPDGPLRPLTCDTGAAGRESRRRTHQDVPQQRRGSEDELVTYIQVDFQRRSRDRRPEPTAGQTLYSPVQPCTAVKQTCTALYSCNTEPLQQ
ncbi:uncharacterized protein [Lepisosteus oculatus]|uniref:uncharacterized protein n=1 Tax=Lepisosteus oculatus TaxID=7918 RepID=UPI003713AE12